MSETTIDGHTYVIGRLNAMQQFDVLCRLGQTVMWFESELRPDADRGAHWLAAIASGWAGGMPEADRRFVLQQSLSVVRRRGANGAAPVSVMNAGGQLQFENEMDMETMLELSDLVLQESLGPFFERRRAARAAASEETTGETTPLGSPPGATG